VAFIDEKGNWVGPGPDPRQAGSTTVGPATFDPNKLPAISPPAGYSPTDWTKLIQGNSNYMAWGLNAAERADAAAANRKAALRALAVRYGGLPTGFKDVYGDLSQQDLETAQANPLSEFSRLQKGYGDSVEQWKRQLAARRALQSGELGYGLGQIDYQHSADMYDMNQQVMDAAQAYVNQYAGTLSGLSQEQIDAIRQAAMDVYGQGYRLGGAGGEFDYHDIGELTEAWQKSVNQYAPAGQKYLKIGNNGQATYMDDSWAGFVGERWTGAGYYINVTYADPNGGTNTIWIPVAAGSGPGAGSTPPSKVKPPPPDYTTPAVTPDVRTRLAYPPSRVFQQE
jgi:hypothetical protein